MSRAWDEARHPRDDAGRFAEAWAGRISARLAPTRVFDAYHATTEREQIQREGLKVGDGAQGAFFGRGVYLHTRKDHADQYLEGAALFISSQTEQMRVRATVRNPFVVRAESDDWDPGAVMRRALDREGIKVSHLDAPGITRELQARGYDSIWVQQSEFNDEIAGDQLVVFDPAHLEVTA